MTVSRSSGRVLWMSEDHEGTWFSRFSRKKKKSLVNENAGPWGGMAPDGVKPVPRTSHGHEKARTWYFLRHEEKALMAIGRTIPGLQPLVSQEQVDELKNQYQFENKVKDMSISMQLDMLATEVLRLDREEYLEIVGERRRAEYPFLSANQWLQREKRETSFPNIEAIDTLLRFNLKFRVHNYHERITNLPFDKHGNLPYVWSRSPQRVGKDPDWEPRVKIGEE